jgi:hypothetical protein
MVSVRRHDGRHEANEVQDREGGATGASEGEGGQAPV